MANALQNGGYTVVGGTPEAYDAFQRAEIDRWRRVGQVASIRME
ncbi:hypothetical protein [Dankookia rubra]|nr:hypothetical protein [Dankookia rubra]